MIKRTIKIDFEGHDRWGWLYYVMLNEERESAESVDVKWDFYLFTKRTNNKVARAQTTLSKNSLEIGWIQTISSDGCGIGSILLDAVLKAAKLNGVDVVTGWTSKEDNTPWELGRLHDFYGRFGACFYYKDDGGHFFIKL